MDELRMARREDGALILVNEIGDEYRLVVDDALAAEVRQLRKRPASPSSVRPREIQAMLRAGKSRAEVAEETGLEEADIERYEEPVRAEQRYMLELAHSVSVRTDLSRSPHGTETEQQFGEVISERLIALGATSNKWRSWRDETTGWLIGLQFETRDGEHDAIWTLDHRKRVLTPLSADATNLSKAGDIGDRLIPKLRAVENEQSDRFDSDAFETKDFDPDALLAETGDQSAATGGASNTDVSDTLYDPDTFEAGSAAQASDEEYERRREIDQLAVNTPTDGEGDLSQTADLLDALRKRRGEREQAATDDGRSGDESPIDETAPASQRPGAGERTGAAANIWGAAGVSGENNTPVPSLRAVDQEHPSGTTGAAQNESDARDAGAPENETQRPAPEPKSSKKGRAPIPSWDDILFGTRSDEDPS